MAQHLGKREGRADLDAPGAEPPRERIEDTVAPAHEVEVVPEPAKQGLEGMVVGVHTPGKNETAGEPEGLLGDAGWAARGRRERRPRSRGGDAAALEADGPVVLDGARREAPLGQEEHESAAPSPTLAGHAWIAGITKTDSERHGRTRARGQAPVERPVGFSGAGATRPGEGGRPDG